MPRVKDFTPDEPNKDFDPVDPASPDVEALQAKIDKLEAENAALKAEKTGPVAKEGHKIIFVSSKGGSVTSKLGTGGGKPQKVVTGSVNGVKFEVECDKQVEVPDHVAEALAGLLEAQAQG